MLSGKKKKGKVLKGIVSELRPVLAKDRVGMTIENQNERNKAKDTPGLVGNVLSVEKFDIIKRSAKRKLRLDEEQTHLGVASHSTHKPI